MSLNSSKIFATLCAFSPKFAKIIPTNNAKKIICNIFPSAIALIGFVGIKLSTVSFIETAFAGSAWAAWLTLLRSIPTPGFINDANNSAKVIAKAVVNK